MKKILLLFCAVCMSVFICGAIKPPKKIKCHKPIYFFENVQKNDFFGYVDEHFQEKQYKVKKFYPELGFISINYQNGKKSDTVAFNLKQYGNDLYLFIDIEKGNTQLEKQLYAHLKKHSINSYLIKDDFFCRELTKDVNLINTKRKNYLQEDDYNPFVYQISMKRYIGYDKKTYFKDKLKNIFKKKKKDKKKKVKV